ncbi:unnamed protein product [Gadus morhua 'NCC']
MSSSPSPSTENFLRSQTREDNTLEDRGGPGLGAARAPGPRQGFPRSASLPAGDPLARGAAAVGDDDDAGGVLCPAVTPS